MKRALTIAAVADLVIVSVLLHTPLKDWLWTHPWTHSFLVAVPTIALAVIAFVELRHSEKANELREEANRLRVEGINHQQEANELRERGIALSRDNAQLTKELDAERNKHLQQIAINTKPALTQAVINAERAWIVVNVESTVRNQFIFKATNVGRTPAKITSIWSSNAVVRKRGEKFQLSPDYEKGESLLNTPPCLLPPSKDCIVFRCNIEELRGEHSYEQWMKYLAEGLSMVWSYGRITYFDTLAAADTAILRETKWLYWHIAPDRG
jgi:hypothetical protein